MRIMKLATKFGVAVGLLLAVVQFGLAEEAKTFSYIGNKGCKMCHQGAKNGEIYEKWATTGHAKAFANLPAEAKTNKECFACHTTGYGKAGGYAPDAKNAAELEGVGCEACHGPGSDYKALSVMKDPAKAKAAGLIAPDEKVCVACHVGKVPEGHKALPKFDFATAVKKVEHKKAPAAK